MKPLRILPLIVLISMLQALNLTGQHFQNVWSENPYKPMCIIIDSAFLDGMNLQPNDEIAVFDSNLVTHEITCVGSIILNYDFSPDTNVIISASYDDPTTVGVKDGFSNGSSLLFRIWDSSDEEEINIVGPIFNASYSQLYSTLETSMTELQAYSVLIWTGTVSNNWNNPSNWIIPMVPNEFINVLIPGTIQGAHFPELYSTGNCSSIILEEGSNLTIHGTLTVSDSINQ